MHVSKLRNQAECFSKEKFLCDQLYLQIKNVKNIHKPEYDNVYSDLMKKVRALADFYMNMKNAANTTADDVENLLTKINSELEDNLIANKRTFGFNIDNSENK